MLDFLFSIGAVDALYLPAALTYALIAWSPLRARPHPAGLAIAAGFFAGFLLTRPLPLVPPVGGIGWYPFVLALGLACGLAADRPRWRLVANALAIVALPLLINAAIASDQLGGRIGTPPWFIYSLLTVAGILAMTRLAEDGDRPSAAYALFFAAAGLAAVGWLYGTRVSVHAITLAAGIAAAGFALKRYEMDWPRSASFAAGALYLAIAATLFFSRDYLALPVGITVLAFFARPFADLLTRESRMRRPIEIGFGLASALGAGIVTYYSG